MAFPACSSGRGVIALALFLAVPSLAIAQTNRWERRDTSLYPINTRGSFTYDSVRQEVVAVDQGTRVFGGSTWAHRASSGPPYAWLAFDEQRGVTVGYQPNVGSGTGLTWEWNGASWTQVGNGPPREHAGLSYAGQGRVLVFGGHDGGGHRSDTFLWDGNSWSTYPASTRPGNRSHPSICYDSTRDRVLLYGGHSGGFEYNDTWQWTEAGGWRQLLTPAPITSAGPNPRSTQRSAWMAWDAHRDRAMLVSTVHLGSNKFGFEHWEFALDAATGQHAWRTVSPATLPPSSQTAGELLAGMPGLAFDESRDLLVTRLQYFPGYYPTSRQSWVYLPDPAVPPDTTPPDVTITAPTFATLTAAPDILLQATVVDESTTDVTSVPSGIMASLPAGGGSVSGTLPLAEGLNQLVVSAIDAEGNVGGSSVDVVRDSIAPSITIDSPAEGSIYGSPDAGFVISITDLTATTVTFGANTIALNAGGGTATGNVALTPGVNVVQVDAVDAVGNAATLQRTLIYDTSAPNVTIDAPLDGAIFGPGSESINVAVTVADLTSTAVSSTPTGVTGTLPAGGGTLAGEVALSEGTNPIQVVATDTVGLSSSDTVAVIYDSTPPNIVIDSPSAGLAVRGTIEFAASVVDPLPGSAVASVALQVDGSTIETLTGAPYESRIDSTLLADGIHTLSVVATDGIGNSAIRTQQILVDNTEPSLVITDPTAGSLVAGLIAFDTTANDSGSGVIEVTMTAAGAAPSPVDGSIVLPLPQGTAMTSSQVDTSAMMDGPLVLAVSATDAAGNQASASILVQTDNTAPDKALLTPAEGEVVRGTIPITAESLDPDLASIEIFVESQSLGISTASPFTVSYDTTARLDGPMVIYVLVADNLGNQSTCATTVTVDNVASIDCVLNPRTLNMKSNRGGVRSGSGTRGVGPKGMQKKNRGKSLGRTMTLWMEGDSLGLLLPIQDHSVELRIAGASPVTALSEFTSGLVDENNNGIPELTVKFDRQELIAAIRAALATGQIAANSLIPVQVFADDALVCEDHLRILN